MVEGTTHFLVYVAERGIYAVLRMYQYMRCCISLGRKQKQALGRRGKGMAWERKRGNTTLLKSGIKQHLDILILNSHSEKCASRKKHGKSAPAVLFFFHSFLTRHLRATVDETGSRGCLSLR